MKDEKAKSLQSERDGAGGGKTAFLDGRSRGEAPETGSSARESGWLLLNYTRLPVNEKVYDPRLAYSIHLALAGEGEAFQPLNHNSGVLFAKAEENPDGSLVPKSIRNPWIFSLGEEGYGVIAVRTGADGEPDRDSEGSVLVWRTKDFLCYEEEGLLPLGRGAVDRCFALCDPKTGSCRVVWRTAAGAWYEGNVRRWGTLRLAEEPRGLSGGELAEAKRQFGLDGEVPVWPKEAAKESGKIDIEGAVPHNILRIPEACAQRLRIRLLPPVNTGVTVPAQIRASNREEVLRCRAALHYSDGTCRQGKIDWDLSGVDFQKKGRYLLNGTIRQEHFAFPVAENRADPCVFYWEGTYYFIATNDADDNRSLYVREADTLTGLAGAEEFLILDAETWPEIGNLLWAPEFHAIDGRLYLFFAATPGEFFCEESCVMELREGGNPTVREDWSRPRRIVRKDGSDLCEAGRTISLDMTCFEWEGELWAVWSQRQFLPKDLGAWLYLARLDRKRPWRLASDPVVLSKPEYGWANNHTFVDEGPFALPGEGRLYLTFSSACPDTSYVVGLLTIERGKDLMVRENWKKTNYPILTSRSVAGEYGTGHNAYVTDGDGTVWNTYHARPGLDSERCSGIRRVHFGPDGFPVLDLTEENDVRAEYRSVTAELLVEGGETSASGEKK